MKAGLQTIGRLGKMFKLETQQQEGRILRELDECVLKLSISIADRGTSNEDS